MKTIPLRAEHKLFIITALATFMTPVEICKEFHELFGFEVSQARVWRWDPTKPANVGHVKQIYIDLFNETRKRFLTETADIAIANKAWRLAEALKLYRRLNEKAVAMKRDLLEYAAKEAGGLFTNRHELSGVDGQPIEINSHAPDLSRLDPEERLALLKISEKLYGGSKA